MKKIIPLSLENSKVRTVKTDSEVQVAVGDKNVVLKIQLLDEGTHKPKELKELGPFEFRATNPGRNVIVKTDGFTIEKDETFLDFILPEEIFSQSGLITDAVIRANINDDVYSTEHFFILILPTPGIYETYPVAIDAIKTAVNDLRTIIDKIQNSLGNSTDSIITNLQTKASNAIDEAIKTINSDSKEELSAAISKAVDSLIDSFKQENEPKIQEILTNITNLANNTSKAIQNINDQIPEKQKELDSISDLKTQATNNSKIINDLKTEASNMSDSTTTTLKSIEKEANNLLNDIKQTASELLTASLINSTSKTKDEISNISLNFNGEANDVLTTIAIKLKDGSSQIFSMTETIKKVLKDNPSLVGDIPNLDSYATKKYVDNADLLKANKTDLDVYAKKADMPDFNDLATLSYVDKELSTRPTKSYVNDLTIDYISYMKNDKYSDALDGLVFYGNDAQGYTKEAVSAYSTIKNVLDESPELINNKVKLPDLSTYATKKYVDDGNALKTNNLDFNELKNQLNELNNNFGNTISFYKPVIIEKYESLLDFNSGGGIFVKDNKIISSTISFAFYTKETISSGNNILSFQLMDSSNNNFYIDPLNKFQLFCFIKDLNDCDFQNTNERLLTIKVAPDQMTASLTFGENSDYFLESDKEYLLDLSAFKSI